MENIDIDGHNKQVTIRINMGLYGYEAVLQALSDFTQNFWVAVYGDINKEILVSLKPKPDFMDDVDLDELGLEFCNYVLGTMQGIA